MIAPTIMIPAKQLQELGFSANTGLHYQLSPSELVEQTVLRGQGVLNDTGALCIQTGEFTGRSPKDKFIVKDAVTENSVDWNNFNIPIEEKYFHQLKKKLLDYLGAKEEVWIRDAYACADPAYRLNIRVINENPWSNLFAHNMFFAPKKMNWKILNPNGISYRRRVLKQILQWMEQDNTILLFFSLHIKPF
jgi:phosphoenolpyruvate carboxykinase (ATP)